MKIVKMNEVEKAPAAGPLFTGDDVSRQPLALDSKDFNIAVVNFGRGVKNKLHTHGSDQVLIVTHGRGVVATEHEHREVTVGDVIFAPAGERHWHGAQPGETFSHITIMSKESKTTQLEP